MLSQYSIDSILIWGDSMKITTGFEKQKMPERKLNPRAFLIFEGHRTEVKYFQTLADMKATARLSDNVEVVVLDRFEHDSGISDPLNVLDLSEKYVKFLETGEMTSRLFAGYCADCAGIKNEFRKFNSDLDLALRGASLIECDRITDVCEAEKVAKRVLSDFGYDDVDLNFYRVDYDKRCDTVNIIIDRDRSKSRPDEKYRMFLERCEELRYIPYVTNPKFELWLLCHYDGAQEALRAICVDPNPAALLDHEMERRGYKKKKEDFSERIRNIDLAMENSSILESDVDKLTSEVGTNIPKLIEALRVNDY